MKTTRLYGQKDLGSRKQEQLLSHTAGIFNVAFPPYTSADKLPTIVQALNGEAPAHNKPVTVTYYPGKLHAYTGGGYVILELLLMDIEKKAYPAIIEQEILNPLQMDNSTFNYHLPDQRFPSIACGHLKKNEVIGDKYFITYPLSFGGLWSTPTDLAKFLSEIQRSLNGKPGHSLLNQGNTQLMLKPISYADHAAGGQYALGWKAINKIKKLVGRKYWVLGPYHPKGD